MAIAALVLGIVAIPLFLIFIPAVLALIFGLIAASTIKKQSVRERLGLARAGWILGVVSMVIGVAVWVAVALFVDDTEAWDDLEVGNCVNTDFDPDDSDTDQQRFPVKDCNESHDAEIVAVDELNPDRDEPYPSEAELGNEAFQVCADGLRSYTGEDPQTGAYIITPYLPAESAWRPTRGKVVCFAFPNDGGKLDATIEQ